MPIEKKPAFITTDGTPFLNQDAAQEHEFDLLFKEQIKEWMQENADFRKAVLTTLVAYKAEALAILSTRKPHPQTPHAEGRKGQQGAQGGGRCGNSAGQRLKPL